MKRRIFVLVCVLLIFSGFKKLDPVKVYLVGDSTLSIKEVKYYPETGWGMPFSWFFDDAVKVDNRAQNGKSTGSFIKENRWQPIVESLNAKDYVLIQFGHNDEVSTKKTYTTETQFVANLTKYVTETRSRGAFPVLITPVTRRAFDENGNLTDTHAAYAQLVRDVAKSLNVPLIDLTNTSMDMVQNMGEDKSAMLYNHLLPGENPNYPNGKEDNTHFNELGARKMAELVLQGIRDLKLPLAEHIRNFENK